MFVSMRMSIDKHGTPFFRKAELSGEPAPAQMSRKKGCLKSRTDCTTEVTCEETGGNGSGMDSATNSETGAGASAGPKLSGADMPSSGFMCWGGRDPGECVSETDTAMATP